MKLVEEDLTGRVYSHNDRRSADRPFFGMDRRRGPRRVKGDRRTSIRFEADRRTNAGRRKSDFDMRDYQVNLK